MITNTVMHRELNTRFPSSEGGMTTLRLRRSCRQVWEVKSGMRTTAMENNVRDAGAMKRDAPLASTENTYENIPRDVLRSVHPIQSISVLMRWNMEDVDRYSSTGSFGSPKMEIMKMRKVKMAPI